MISFVYGVMHAMPVLIAGTLYGTKSAVWISCAVMAVVAVAVGEMAYAWMDLSGVAVGTAIALFQLRRAGRKNPSP